MAKFIFDRDKSAAYFNMGILFLFSILMAVICTLLRSFSYLFFFDADPGYFTDSFLPDMASSMLVLVTLFLLSGFFFIAKNAEIRATIDSSDNIVFFTSVFAGFIMLADFAFKVYTFVGDEKISYYKFIFNKAYKADDAYTVRAMALIEIVGLIASVAAACCFFIRSSKKASKNLNIAFGFFPIIRALAGIAQIYFEMEVQMNHPSKLMLQFALISIMLFLLAEERYYVSKLRPRSYFIFGCIALFLGFTGGVSEMVGFFSGNLNRGDFCVEAFLCLTVSFYIFARVRAFTYIKQQYSADGNVPDVSAEMIGDETEINDSEDKVAETEE